MHIISILLYFALVFGVDSKKLAPAASSEEQVYTNIRENYPKSEIDHEKINSTYSTLNRFYQRMVAQLKLDAIEYAGLSTDFSSKLIIINSDIVNAFTAAIRDPESQQVNKSITYITTAFLSDFLNVEGVDHLDAEKRILALVGVLAHELAHAIDKADPDGIEARFGKDSKDGSSVALELRTDAEAQKLLQKSGLPIDALYLANEIMSKGVGIHERMSSIISTHPESTFRTAVQRNLITRSRIKSGSNLLPKTDSIDDVEFERIKQEINALYKRSVFQLPGNFYQLNQMLTPSVTGQYLNTEQFNALVLWFDNQIANNSELKIDDIILNLIRRKIMAYPQSLCATKNCLEKLLLTSKIPGISRLKLIPHNEYVEKLEFYNSSTLIDSDLISRQLKDPHNRGNPTSEFKIRKLGGESYVDFYDANFFDPFAHDITRGFSFNNTIKYIDKIKINDHDKVQTQGILAFVLERPNLLAIGDPLPDNQFVHYNSIFHREVILPYVLGLSLTDLSSPIFNISFHFAVPTHVSRNYWKDLLARNSKSKLKTDTLKLIESIWENRGMWSTLEFLSGRNFHIDWDLIGEYLEIPRDQIKNQILMSFKEFIKHRLREQDTKSKIQMYRPLIEKQVPVWLSANLDHFLLDIINGHKDSNVSIELKKVLMHRYYTYYPQDLVKKIGATFDNKIQSNKPKSADDIHILWNESLEVLLGSPQVVRRDSPKNKISLVVNALYRHGVNSEVITSFLSQLFSSTRFSSLTDFGTENLQSFYDELLKVKRVKNLLDFFNQVKIAQMNQWPNDKNGYARKITKQVIIKLNASLIKEINHIVLSSSDHELVSYLSELAKIINFTFKVNEYNHSSKIATVFLSELSKRSMTFKQKLNAFWILTSIVVNSETDMFFKKFLLPTLKGNDKDSIVKGILKNRRILDPSFQVQLFESLQSPQTEPLEVSKVLGDLDNLLPSDSNEKDQLLEKLAWAHNLSGEKLDELIEKRKSTNWRKLSPSHLRYNGAISEVVKSLSQEDRMSLIDYLVRGQEAEKNLDNIILKIKKSVNTTFSRSISLASRVQYFPIEELDFKLAEARSAIVTWVNHSLPVQRVPIIEYLLVVGEKSIDSNELLMSRLKKNYLGLDAQSSESIFLQAYLDIVPSHEKNLILSYFMVNRDNREGGKLNLAYILESMFGTPGIKFGQLAALYNLFGDEYTQQLTSLYNKANPMTKVEIELILKKNLGADFYQKNIKRIIKILGSASVKVVVLVEMMDDTFAAVMIKRPSVYAQTKTNMLMSKMYLKRLKHYALESNDPLMQPLIESMEDQIFDELDFKIETKNITASKAMVEKIMKSSANAFSGWTISVPSVLTKIPVTEDVFGLSAVQGVSAKDYFSDSNVSMKEKNIVGKSMVTVALRMLFLFGQFDPDRHPGNWMIDEKNKVIHFIDAGQLASFPFSKSVIRFDGRLAIAQFLDALSKDNSKEIVRAAMNLRPVGINSFIDEKLAVNEVDRVLALKQATAGDTLKEVIRSLYRAGIKLDGLYTFGALKGLMTLAGSNYVSFSELQVILKNEIVKLYVKKAPVIIAQKLLQSSAGVVSKLRCENVLKP